MLKKHIIGLLFLLVLLLISCGTDDAITSLDIETTSDSVVLSQNTEIEIFIFQNDNYIPSNGELTLSNPSLGTVFINDPNNTPNNPSDDSVIYTANSNVVGPDTFQYIICDNLGLSCLSEA